MTIYWRIKAIHLRTILEANSRANLQSIASKRVRQLHGHNPLMLQSHPTKTFFASHILTAICKRFPNGAELVSSCPISVFDILQSS